MTYFFRSLKLLEYDPWKGFCNFSRNWLNQSSTQLANAYSKQFKSQFDRSLIRIFLKHRTVTSQLLFVCFRYDPSTDKWQYICNLLSPRQPCTAGLIGNKMHIIGDYANVKFSDSTQIYDTENGTLFKVRHYFHVSDCLYPKISHPADLNCRLPSLFQTKSSFSEVSDCYSNSYNEFMSCEKSDSPMNPTIW